MDLKRRGKKTAEWENARRKLKIQFENLGVTRCEICGTDNGLSFAHRIKRRFITTEQELMTVALICIKDHLRIEALPPSKMFDEINNIIEARKEYVVN